MTDDKGMYVDAPCDTPQGQTQAMFGLLSAMTMGGRDDTQSIWFEFVRFLRILQEKKPDMVPETTFNLLKERSIYTI